MDVTLASSKRQSPPKSMRTHVDEDAETLTHGGVSVRAVCDNELLLQSAVAVVVRREAPRSDAQQRPARYDPHPPAGDIEGTRKRRTPEGVAREDTEEPVPRLQDMAAETLSKLDRIDAAAPNWEQLAPSRRRGGSEAAAGCEETDRRGRAGKPDVEPPRPGESAHDDEGLLIKPALSAAWWNRSQVVASPLTLRCQRDSCRRARARR